MPRKDCPKCEGTGWQPADQNSVYGVSRCSCGEDERNRALLLKARIPRRYEHCEIANFDIRKDRDTSQPNETLSKAKIDATRYVQDYQLDFGLLFIGPSGVGKTHLAVGVLRALILQKGVECLFCDFRDLLQAIRGSYDQFAQAREMRVLRPVLNTEVLLLDELVSANPSDWVKDTLAYIINSRYNDKKATLITTTLAFGDSVARFDTRGENLTPLERSLNQFGNTLSSRLYEMCKIIQMRSDDYRKAIRQAGNRFHSDEWG
jgi:DNA replication protein DnaC